MHSFSYTARDPEGAFVAGTIGAEDAALALAHLRMRALCVTALERADSMRAVAPRIFTMLPVNSSVRVAFFRSFATLIGSGVPMRRALEVTIEQCSSVRFAEALRSVASDVEAGKPLSAALARRPNEFAALFVAMVKAGELGGALDEVLARLADYLERDRALRKRVASALAYPAIVVLAALGLVLFLIANTVPSFAAMFSQMNVTLPISTRVLVAIGEALKSPIVAAVVLCAAPTLWVGLRRARRVPSLAQRVDRGMLSLPLFGRVVRKAIVARFSRTLGTLLRCGVPIVSALAATAEVVDNAVYRRCIETLVPGLRAGDPLTLPLQASRLFDPLFVQLIRVGEETGSLDAMLLRVAEYYEIDVETAMTTLGTVIEPILIIVLGAIVGTIVASILIPLYSIIGSIK